MFKLLIECSKDISELSINFTDGTSVVTSPESSPTRSESKKNQFESAREELLDLSTDFRVSQTELVTKPEIKENARVPRVAHELQNLDI